MRPPDRRTLLRIALPGGIAAGLGWAARSGSGFTYAGSPVDPGPAPPLVLADDRGSRFDLAAERGRVVLVYFGYTACPDVCPTTLGILAQVLDRLGPQREQVRTVFVTLDPARDTAPVLRDYLANFADAGGRSPIGLTDEAGRIAAAAQAWRITWKPAVGGAFIDHSSVVAAVAPNGQLRLRYGFSQLGDPGPVARDVLHLLRAT